MRQVFLLDVGCGDAARLRRVWGFCGTGGDAICWGSGELIGIKEIDGVMKADELDGGEGGGIDFFGGEDQRGRLFGREERVGIRC